MSSMGPKTIYIPSLGPEHPHKCGIHQSVYSILGQSTPPKFHSEFAPEKMVVGLEDDMPFLLRFWWPFGGELLNFRWVRLQTPNF